LVSLVFAPAWARLARASFVVNDDAFIAHDITER